MITISKINVVEGIDEFSYVKGLREPLYGENNNLIGFSTQGEYYIIGTKMDEALVHHPRLFILTGERIL